MAIVATGWTSWSEDGTPGYALDWSSVSAMRNYPPLVICEVLRQALAEYADLHGVSLGGGYSADFLRPLADGRPLVRNASSAELTGDLVTDWLYWFAAFENTLAGIVGSAVNCMDSGGDWAGTEVTYDAWPWTETYDPIAPLWTMEAMLTYLGESLMSPGGDWAAWAYQRYRMLRLCAWKRQEYEYYYSSSVTHKRSSGSYVDGTDYATAVAAWNAASWVEGCEFQAEGIGGKVLWAWGNSDAVMLRAQRAVTTVAVGGGTHSRDVVVYGKMTHQDNEGMSWAEYENPDYGDGLGPEWAVVDERTGIGGDPIEVSIAADETWTIPEHFNTVPDSSKPFGYRCGHLVVVSKHNVSGGLVFG